MWSQAQVAWPQALFLHLVYGHTQVAPPTTVHTIFLIPPGLDRVALIVGSAVPGDDDMSYFLGRRCYGDASCSAEACPEPAESVFGLWVVSLMLRACRGML